MKSNTIVSLVAGTALLVGSLGCVQEEQPPELPPVGTMQTELGTIESAPQVAKDADPDALGDYSNFANAWVRVKLLQAYGTGIVFIPAVAMGLALTQDPSYQGDRWVWSVTVGQTTGDLELSGGPLAGWDVEFFVSNPVEGISNFLWIEGHSNPDLTEGYWLGHDVNLPAGEDEVLEIAWRYTSETDRSLAYSNVKTSSPDLGDVITYTVLGTTATVVYDDASDEDLIANITWDTTTGVGSIQVPYYNGGEKACWDASFRNAPCL
jgi:hypothetical protein